MTYPLYAQGFLKKDSIQQIIPGDAGIICYIVLIATFLNVIMAQSFPAMRAGLNRVQKHGFTVFIRGIKK